MGGLGPQPARAHAMGSEKFGLSGWLAWPHQGATTAWLNLTGMHLAPP